PQTGVYDPDTKPQTEQIFANVALNLRDAGGEGWGLVFWVDSCHLPLNSEALEAPKKGFRKCVLGHLLLWTCEGEEVRLGC
ncbi:hypothetical protein P171DRAFT_500692, partial [Karstenula rhodostoma CBS 690.94]